MFLTFAFSILFACRSDKVVEESDIQVDSDGDGFSTQDDCDDSNALVNPDMTETCDGIDNNCDEQIDEGVLITFYLDGDGDGIGIESNSVEACARPEGYSVEFGDCNDTDATIYPDAEELCDGFDNDCDETTGIDEGVMSTWYLDEDSDGFGVGTLTTESCDEVTGYVSNSDDCDDSVATTYPDAPEYCDGVDNDCDEDVDEDPVDPLTWYFDGDGDGFGDTETTLDGCQQPSGYTAEGGDCDDTDMLQFPNATELPNNEDDDCDGTTDEGTVAFDDDGDGFTENDGDCNDADPLINPGQPEIENGVDDDCDGVIDEGTAAYDDDGDGFSENDGDCDDSSILISPDGVEIVNGVDDDCNGVVDNGTNVYDDDGDGFSEDDGDCNDGDPTINPGAPEIENGIDDDCDTVIDEGTAAFDDDGDGFSENDGDCDDGVFAINPNAVEDCSDNVDNNCDGLLLEENAISCTVFYRDSDGDSFGDPTETYCDCASGGYDGTFVVTNGDDCDDTNVSFNPNAVDVCDGYDNDCSQVPDDAENCDLWYGNGVDGALTVSAPMTLGGTTTDPYAPMFRVSFVAGNVVHSIAGVNTIFPGDEVLIVNLQGSTTQNASVGNWETGFVEAVSGTQIILRQDVQSIFGEFGNTSSDLAGQLVVVQRVPHFTNLTINSSVTVEPFTPGVGGGVFFVRSQSATISSFGSVVVGGAGYLGAGFAANGMHGFSGGSYSGTIATFIGGPANGGAGGGGTSDCNVYNCTTQQIGGGGAGASYGSYGLAGSNNGNLHVGGIAGAIYGDPYLDGLMLGSGGGGGAGGFSGPGTGTTGGNGGGILFLASQNLSVSGYLNANGQAGSYNNNCGIHGSGGGGGGSGGSLWLAAEEMTISGQYLLSYGGAGACNGGGSGGYGRIRLDYGLLNGNGYNSTGAINLISTQAISMPSPGYTGEYGN